MLLSPQGRPCGRRGRNPPDGAPPLAAPSCPPAPPVDWSSPSSSRPAPPYSRTALPLLSRRNSAAAPPPVSTAPPRPAYKKESSPSSISRPGAHPPPSPSPAQAPALLEAQSAASDLASLPDAGEKFALSEPPLPCLSPPLASPGPGEFRESPAGARRCRRRRRHPRLLARATSRPWRRRLQPLPQLVAPTVRTVSTSRAQPWPRRPPSLPLAPARRRRAPQIGRAHV